MEALLDKVAEGKRVSYDDAIRLWNDEDIFALGEAAHAIRTRKHQNRAFYIRNMHLNYTNVCVYSCSFCAFARRPGEEGSWEWDIQECVHYCREKGLDKLSEVHIVGGVNAKYPYEYYIELVRTIRREFPNAHIKAFTAVELDFISRICRKPVEKLLEDLLAAGLGSLPGGGAEILTDRAWKEVCSGKTPPDKWLNIHRLAHKMGIRSTCTMLYGHVETAEERIEHLEKIRRLQDETGGFTAFIPLAFHPVNTALEHIPAPTGLLSTRLHALARIYLDNIEHIKAYWIMLGPKVAQTLLRFGVDDIDGTIVRETIVHLAGATSPEGLEESELVHLIKEAGFVPVERDTLYNPLKVW